MATQTSLVAQQVRIRQWAEQIRNCQNRPKGMDVETWCTQNNLTKANYYYRLRRVRQICLDQMQDTETTAFVELLSIPIEISILFGNSEHPFPERKNMPFRSRVQPFI